MAGGTDPGSVDNWIWYAHHESDWWFSRPSLTNNATACTFTLLCYAQVSGAGAGKARIQMFADPSGGTTQDCDTGTVSTTGLVTLTATATAGQLAIIGDTEWGYPGLYHAFRTTTVQTAGGFLDFSLTVLSVKMDVTLDYFTQAQNAYACATPAPSTFTISGTWKNDLGLPMQEQWVSVVYFNCDLNQPYYVPSLPPRTLLRAAQVQTDSAGAWTVTLRDKCVYATVLPGRWDAYTTDESLYSGMGVGYLGTPVQHWGHCDTPVAVPVYPGFYARRIRYSPADIAAITGAKIYGNGSSYLSGAQAACDIVTNGYRPKIKVNGLCNNGGVYNLSGVNIRVDTPFGSESGGTDANGVLALSSTDPNAITGVTMVSSLPTCGVINTMGAYSPPTDGPIIIPSPPRTTANVYTDSNIEPRCTPAYVLNTGLVCATCGQQTTLKLAGDVYQPGGVLGVCWINASGALLSSVNRAPLKSISDGNAQGFWEVPVTIEAANASDVGYAYLPNGRAYLCYDLSGAKKYRTNHQMGGGPVGNWSSAGTPSPAVSRHSQSGRGQAQAWRLRALGSTIATSGNIEFSQCGDLQGATWFSPVTVVTGARGPWCGGVWLGNGYGCLYTRDSDNKIYWLRTDNPDSWPAGPGTDTTFVGQVVGLAQADNGILVGVFWDNGTGTGGTMRCYGLRSRDNGATWEKDSSSIANVPAMSNAPIVLKFGYAIFIVWVANDAPQHVVSVDGGVSWL